ncbi:hypothetical protein EXIGLDRAFT_842718 [Exidia glandulosa HHB12029]|uniref:Uncharacterized protein n=1 Tax=Exidia glandulosa HHB12029 TaxID=1314781 RepID=A0A165ZLB7_EXIGL|nr:hypothetical protein EXIGLDRAFT_842718 [Exidia glandulosa HHB12029]
MHSQIHNFLDSTSHFQSTDPLRLQNVPVFVSKNTAALESTPATLRPGLSGKEGQTETVQPAGETMRETADDRTVANEAVDSISAYVDKSVEELRMEDYSAGRKPSTLDSSTAAMFPRFYPSQAFAWESTPGHPFAFPRSVDVSSAASKGSSHPDYLSRHGTQTPAFAVTSATDTRTAPSGALVTANLLFNTITGMPEYANKSIEELRLEDYALSGRLGARSPRDERSGSPPVRSALSLVENPLGASQSPEYQAPKSITAPEFTTDSADGVLNLPQVAGGDDGVDVKSLIAVSDNLPTAAVALSSPVHPHHTPDEHATDSSSPPDVPPPHPKVPAPPVVEQRPPSALDDYDSHSLCIRRLDAEIEARAAEELLRRTAQARVVKLEGELRRLSAEVARLQDVEKRLAEAQIERRNLEES